VKIEITRNDLLRAANIVGGVVERRQTLPILGNMLLEANGEQVNVGATDLEVSINTVMPATVVEPGGITVPARKVIDFCRSLSEEAVVKIKAEGERCLVSSGRTRFTLSSLPAADFPALATEADKRRLTLSAEDFRRLLEKTSFAMAQQDVRYYLNGVLLELSTDTLSAVATDGHRLAKFDLRVGEGVADGDQLIVPAKTVIELRRLLSQMAGEVELCWGERSLTVTEGAWVLRSKLVEGKYPEYQRVIPRGLPRRIVVDREQMKLSLQRAAILSNEKYKGVRIAFEPDIVRLQAQNPEHEVAEDEVAADYDGESVVVGFNVNYLIEVLHSIEVAQVEVSLQDADSSSIWRGRDCPEETFVVMPMRL
jgi:DNA polymerase-3 subunit beta